MDTPMPPMTTPSPTPPFQVGMTADVFMLGECWLTLETARALEARRPSFAVRREMEYWVRGAHAEVLDQMATIGPWNAHRLGERNLIVQGDGFLATVMATERRGEYCFITIEVAALDVAAIDPIVAALEGFLAPRKRVLERGFQLEWHYRTARGDLRNSAIQERVTETLRDSGYPDLPGGTAGFISRYLDAPESILVLQGPPGTGKTQLIRAILAELTVRQGEQVRAMYTNDADVLQSDDYFIEFSRSTANALVIEDADHYLTPRSEGNKEMHRFLSASDGIVRSGKRKIIFSTNLPGLRDIDDALVRPGRCFAHVRLRALDFVEAAALVAAVCGEGDSRERALTRLRESAPGGSYSLATVYRVIGESESAAVRPACAC